MNNAFGTDIIHLDFKNIPAIPLLSLANSNPEINRATLIRLSPESSDFGEFPKLISEDCKLGKGESRISVAEKVETNFFEEDGLCS